MRIRNILATVATGALAATAPTAIAAHEGEHEEYGPEQGDIEFTLGANGGNDKRFDTGQFSLATSLGVFLTEGIELGARHNMTFFDTDDTSSVFVATTRAFADYHFDFDRVQPFIGANAGIRYGNHNVDEVGTAAPEAGIKLFATENTFILGMAEYQWFFDEADDLDNNADDGQFVYTVGIGVNF
jgi:hypothetical protein